MPIPEAIRAAVRKWLLATDESQVSKPERLSPVGVGTLIPHARRIGVSTSKERAPVSEIDDRLTELYVRQDEARKAENRELQSRSIRPERSGRRSVADG